MDCYFDNSATTRVSDRVFQVVKKTMLEDYGNPSSRHGKGVAAERYVKDAAQKIARTLKCSPKEILFTSGGTESDNLAIIGAALMRKGRGKHLITTAVEHPAVYKAMEFLEEQGFSYTVLPVDENGHVSPEDLEAALRPDTILVSVMHVNNEIGAVEPVEVLADVIKRKNPDTLFHVDAIQSYGKYRIRPDRMGIDLLSVSGHKLHGPKGVGFLYIRNGVHLHPILFGGGQQGGLRSGTINVPGIAGMGEAAEEAYERFEEKVSRMQALKDRLTEGVLKLPEVRVNSKKGEESAPHIVSISVKGVRSEVLLHALEDRGISVSSGSACSSNHPGISGTLKGIGLPKELLDSTIRVSLCPENTEEEADYFLSAFTELVPALRRFS